MESISVYSSPACCHNEGDGAQPSTMPYEFPACLLALALFAPALAQGGTVRGRVTLKDKGTPIHNAHVLVSPLGRSMETDSNGEYEFANIPAGAYTVLAHMHALTDISKSVSVTPDGTATADFALGLEAVRESITVTATGQEVSVQESFQTVTSKDSFDLAVKSASTSLGDALDNEPGIAKRSGGPGTTRPVIRGFDGDRVLVLQDGIRTGTLSSQSGDHGEPFDPNTVERVEVVRGPATLLYGSNAIGGVVNVLTNHHILSQHPHEGLHGYVSATGGTANGQGGASGGFEYGRGDWLFTADGGGMRTGNYHTPAGTVLNSFTDMSQASLGVGRYGEKHTFNAGYMFQEGTFGVPVPPGGGDEGPVSLQWTRQNFRFNGVAKNLGPALEDLQFAFNYSDWNHKELIDTGIGTQFFNKQFTYRGSFTQRKHGHLSGSFGVWGMARDYKAIGAEALSPPTRQNAVAVFGLEELSFEHVRFQFGARAESNHYTPQAGSVSPETGEPYFGSRFTGISFSTGAFVPLWHGGAFVANYIHSYRAPALEELYSFGPHPGNNVFEIGNANLTRESGDGIELSFRHKRSRFQFETNLFYNSMHDFVYFEPTGVIEEGLPQARYNQANSTFIGAEARAEFALHPSLWLLTGFDVVDAQIVATDTPLPRIPPVRGRLALDWRHKGFGVRPELILANKQWQVAPLETPTAGYVLPNLTASYSLARLHTMHLFHLNFFNMSNTLYRNHLSFIKEYAPEIGRGIRFGYTFQWF